MTRIAGLCVWASKPTHTYPTQLLTCCMCVCHCRWMDWESKLAYYDRTYGELFNEW